MSKLKMELIDNRFVVCKLKPEAKIPSFLLEEKMVSITRTNEELSIVCLESTLNDFIDDFGKAEVFPGWRVLKVLGPLDFSLVGILSEISNTLADVGVSIFAISTFDTDYIYVKEESLDKSIQALENSEIVVIRS